MIKGSVNPNRVEAPVTFKAYMLCAFASFGGEFSVADVGQVADE